MFMVVKFKQHMFHHKLLHKQIKKIEMKFSGTISKVELGYSKVIYIFIGKMEILKNPLISLIQKNVLFIYFQVNMIVLVLQKEPLKLRKE